MKKFFTGNSMWNTSRLLVWLPLVFFFSQSVQAQSKISLEKVRTTLEQQRTTLELAPADLTDMVITDQYTDAHNQVTHVYLQQRYQGIAIEGAVMSLHFKNGTELIHLADRFQKRISGRISSGRSQLSATDAVRRVSGHLGLKATQTPQLISQSATADKKSLIRKEGLSRQDIPVGLIYENSKSGRLQLAWKVEIYTEDGEHYWQIKVDASTGEILARRDMVLHCDFGHPATGAGICTDGHSALAVGSTPLTTAAKSDLVTNIATSFSPPVGNAYRVFTAPVETPNHGGRTLVYTNGDPVASPFGWHNDGLLSYQITKGNNVYAYEDQLGINAGTPVSGGLSPLQPLNFDFPLDLSKEPSTYKKAAVTNLFYWNNLVHDVFYHYGFTESAGNFQSNNRAKGGLGNDAVMAEAQDGGGTNNANFLTLPDGVPGRMQMYLWSSNEVTELVHIESSVSYTNGGPSFLSIQAAFGPALDQTGISGDLVLIEGSALSSSACSSCGCGTGQGVGLPPSNLVLGKVVLIDRGDCAFIEKAQSAQLGGASGIIVVNNIPGEGLIAMGGDETGASILIPAVMINYEDGQILKNELALGAVQIGLRRLGPPPPMKDGDLDNGIITHEYGHGISTRLTGGPSQTCLTGDEQAGEGWSDFFALMMTMDQNTLTDGGYAGRGIGTYVFDQPILGNGIRPARYARDMTVNGYTYADINNAEITVPHGIGFVFCTALWDMTWNLIDAYGYNPDLVNGTLADGNILAIQLVMDGLKMQPCSPTFLESRDAILAADQVLTGGANQCLIWEAFAKRGMGYSALSGTNSRGDEVEAFDMPPTCQANITISQLAAARINNGQEIAYTLRLQNSGTYRSKKMTVSNPLPLYTSYVSGSANKGGKMKSGVLTFSNIQLDGGETLDLTFRLRVNAPVAGDLYFDDDLEDGISKWNAALGLNMWSLTDDDAYSGNYAWFAADPDNLSNQLLTLAQGLTIPDGAELRFRHKFVTEADFDGGVVELSNDGGLTWYDLGNQITRNGYNNFIPAANNLLINGFAFGGSSNGWIESVINLDLFADQHVLIRYRLSSDVLSGGQGWWIDDVIIGKDLTYVENTAYYSIPGEDGGTSTVSTLVLDGSAARQLPAGQTAAQRTGSFNVQVFPNPVRDRVQLQLDQLDTGDLRIELSNLHGQRLITNDYQVLAGTETISLDVSELPAGWYLVVVTNSGQRKTTRLIIE